MAALLLALNGELRHIRAHPRLVWFHNASTETVPSFHNATSLGRLSRNVEKVTGKKTCRNVGNCRRSMMQHDETCEN